MTVQRIQTVLGDWLRSEIPVSVAKQEADGSLIPRHADGSIVPHSPPLHGHGGWNKNNLARVRGGLRAHDQSFHAAHLIPAHVALCLQYMRNDRQNNSSLENIRLNDVCYGLALSCEPFTPQDSWDEETLQGVLKRWQEICPSSWTKNVFVDAGRVKMFGGFPNLTSGGTILSALHVIDELMENEKGKAVLLCAQLSPMSRTSRPEFIVDKRAGWLKCEKHFKIRASYEFHPDGYDGYKGPCTVLEVTTSDRFSTKNVIHTHHTVVMVPLGDAFALPKEQYSTSVITDHHIDSKIAFIPGLNPWGITPTSLADTIPSKGLRLVIDARYTSELLKAVESWMVGCEENTWIRSAVWWANRNDPLEVVVIHPGHQEYNQQFVNEVIFLGLCGFQVSLASYTKLGNPLLRDTAKGRLHLLKLIANWTRDDEIRALTKGYGERPDGIHNPR